MRKYFCRVYRGGYGMKSEKSSKPKNPAKNVRKKKRSERKGGALQKGHISLQG